MILNIGFYENGTLKIVFSPENLSTINLPISTSIETVDHEWFTKNNFAFPERLDNVN